MSARAPKWEIVQSDAGFHARFRASNGRVIVTTEVYERRRAAEMAVQLVTGATIYTSFRPDCAGQRSVTHGPVQRQIEVLEVDERTPPPPTPDITARAFGGWI